MKKSFQLETSTQSEMQRSMMVQDGCELLYDLYDFLSKMWAFFFLGNLGDKKEKGRRLLRETETSQISFDRVTEYIFNLWINKYVVCNVQFVKNVLVPLEFMLHAWNGCSFSPLIIISHFLKSNERWFIPLLWPYWLLGITDNGFSHLFLTLWNYLCWTQPWWMEWEQGTWN